MLDADLLPWLTATEASGWRYTIVTTPPGTRRAVERRLAAFGLSGQDSFVVEQDPGALGTLGGTGAAWRAWRAAGGGAEDPVVIAHGAGAGARAGPLTRWEVGGRASLRLPGRVRGQPARLLELVLHSLGPLAGSLPPGWVDVLWVSQVLVPRVAPGAVPPPRAPLTKLTAWSHDRSLDLGRFVLDEPGEVRGFAPQGTPPPPGRSATDLGSFRARADLLDAWAAEVDGRVDLDPGFIAHLWGDPSQPAARMRAAWGEPFLGHTPLGEDPPWWRFRRPEELTAALQDLRPSRPAGAPLRRLLGLDDPVVRCWIGGVWVPRIPAEVVRAGVEVGGVHLRDAVLVDSAVSDGFLHEAVAWDVAGRAALDHGASAASSDPTPGLWYGTRWTDPPPTASPALPEHTPPWRAADLDLARGGRPVPYPAAVVQALRAASPPGSRLARLTDLLQAGKLPLQVHEGHRPMLALAPERGVTGAVPLHATEAAVRQWAAAPERGVEALIRTFVAHLCRPTPRGRAAEAERAVQQYRAGTLQAVIPRDPLAALLAWRAVEDPLELGLGAALEALDRDPPPVPTEPRLRRAWARWTAERGQVVDVGPGTESLLFADPARGALHLPALNLRPPGLPSFRTPLDRLAGDLLGAGHRIIGVCGPAAAGKTTLALALQARAPHARVIHADAFTWPGPGFRYEQHEGGRHIRLAGPGLFDDVALAAAMDPGDGILIVEGCFVGLDPEVLRRLDALVAVIVDDGVRLRDKVARDRGPGGRQIDVVADFVHKTFVEGEDGLVEVVDLADQVWDRGTGERWVRPRAARPTSPHLHRP